MQRKFETDELLITTPQLMEITGLGRRGAERLGDAAGRVYGSENFCGGNERL